MSDSMKKSLKSKLLKKRNVYLILLAAGILTRVPFFGSFEIVTYDGTYYINQARSILGQPFPAGSFPIGYPALIALLIPVVKNGVLAARVISLIAGIGLPILVYELTSDYTRRKYALIAALLVVITPLCIRMSLVTMSESIYIFWVFLGLLLFARGRELFSGISIGLAAITRPEAIGIFGILALLRLRRGRKLIMILAGFLAVYSVNIIVQSANAGRPVLISKTEFFGSHAEKWKWRESWLDSEKKEEIRDKEETAEKDYNIFADYFSRIPGELWLLIKHATAVLFLLALYGIYRKRFFLLASFIPFIIYPLFTKRSEIRLIFPYLPAMASYAMIGLSSVKEERARKAIYVLISLSVLSGLIINREQLTETRSDDYRWARKAGELISRYIRPGDKVADRKPYVAFYSGGRYHEIPLAPYNGIMDHLMEEDVKWLVCDKHTINTFRPELKGLLYDEALVNGELRYSQALFSEELLLYKKNPGYESLNRKSIINLQNQRVSGLSWSPDGKKFVYITGDHSGGRTLHIYTLNNGRSEPVLRGTSSKGFFSWMPDSEGLLCYRRKDGNVDIYIYHLKGELERITYHKGIDIDPFCSSDGREIVFVSTRSNSADIWIKNLNSGELKRITSDGKIKNYPVISPDGKRIAWVRKKEGILTIFHRSRGRRKEIKIGDNIFFPPSWSPNSRYLAVSRGLNGKIRVCLIDSGGEIMLQLIGSGHNEVNPAWSPGGKELAVITVKDEIFGIRIISGLEQYFQRIDKIRQRSYRPRTLVEEN